MRNGWYKKAAKNDIALTKEAINWKDVSKGLGWGAGVGTIPLALSLMTGNHNKQQTEQPQSQAITQPAITQPKSNQPVPQNTPLNNESEKINSAKDIKGIDKIMDVIHQLESNRGVNAKARFEPEFLKNYGNKGLMPTLRKRYGDRAAASSYGPYQVMLLKAWEMGFKISPEELSDPETNKKVAESIVLSYLEKGYKPWQVFKRYNGGDEYANRAMNLFEGSR